MNDVLTICRTTCTRILRTRSLYVLLAAVLILVATTHLYTDLTGGRQKEFMYDVGGALLTLVGILTALMVTFDIARDLREKMVMVMLSKPLGRAHYLTGKFLGVAWLMTINLAILTVGIFWLLRLEDGVWQWSFLKLALSTWGSMVMLTAVGVVFVSIFNELPAALLTLLTFVIGQSAEQLFHAGSRLVRLAAGLLPNFGLLDFKTEFGSCISIPWPLIAIAIIYALVYSVAMLSLAALLFQRRDLA